ncbi:MAG: XTP/dITP diphosphatase [Methanomassiliicoccales archaeon]|jgi:XTP/dITP diphosphohydrolase|nr:XTP/dITP diphosphatase [Methanomassiliicoccales archaeon]
MRLSIVTSNRWKIEELGAALTPLGIEVEMSDVDCEEIQADSLEEVVHHCLDELKMKGMTNFILDDSGLFIRHLKGFPGVYSSYVFKTLGCSGILKLMNGVEDREAYFQCCIGCIIDDKEIIVSERTYGVISTEERGDGGFGFDPIFIPKGGTRTFAEMSIEEKNRISHRGKAISALVSALEERFFAPDRRGQ